MMAGDCKDGAWVNNWKKEVTSLKFNGGVDTASVQFSATMPGNVIQSVEAD